MVVKDTMVKWEKCDNCTQAVVSGILEAYKNKDAKAIEEAFLAYSKGLNDNSICGALLGSISALSKIFSDYGFDMDTISNEISTLKTEFKNNFGCTHCFDLLDGIKTKDGEVNFNDPEAKDRCASIIFFSVMKAKELIDNQINPQKPIMDSMNKN
jgi:hypothetical protein